MGAVDLLNRAYFTATRPFDRLNSARLGTRLMRGGTEARGRIEGIKTTRSEASSNQWIWVFSVTVRPGSADPFRVAFQQNLIGGQRQRLHPGAEVRIRHDERRRRALIDWPAMLAAWGHPTSFDTPDSWRPVYRQVPDGITDHSQKRLKGELTEATIADVAFETVDVRPSLSVALADGSEHVVRRLDIPEYAFFLLAEGNRIPAAVSGRRLRFDWPGACNAAIATPPRATLDFDAIRR